MFYDYNRVRSQAANHGLAIDEDKLNRADTVFHSTGMNQKQVDTVLDLYMLTMIEIFTPRHYTIGQRIKLALFFLFGSTISKD